MIGRCWHLLLAVNLLAIMPNTLWGQEALRQSLAGEAALRSQKQAEMSVGYYNLKLGDMTMRFSSGLGLQYNDNIHLSGDHREGDFLFTPNLNTQIRYPVTQNNSLNLSISAGYTAYVSNQNLNRYYVNPGTGLGYNIYVGDFVINLHERASVTENGYQNPTANGNGENASFNNAAGVTVNWDLNQVILSANYDHANYASLGSGVRTPDSASDNLSLSGGIHLLPELLVGLETGGSSIRYASSGSDATYPDSIQWSAGAFGNYQITEHMSVSLHGGYTELQPQGSNTNFVFGSQGGMYFALALSHRVNEHFDYTLTASRSQTLQSYGQPYTAYWVRLSPNWKVLHNFSLSTPVWWTQGTQTYYQANTYNQYGVGINLGRQLTEKLSGSLAYQFVDETGYQDYFVNIISLNFSYRF